MTQVKFLLLTITSLIILFISTDPALTFINKSFLSAHEPLLEPLFLLLLGSTLSTIVLFINKELFKKWFKKFIVWYFPFTLFLTFLFPTSGYTMPHRYDIAVLFSGLMVLVTLIMMGYSYFSAKGDSKSKRGRGQ